MLCHMNLHLDRSLQVLNELRRHRADVVHFLVLEHRAESGLLHRLGSEGLAEEVVGDVSHFAEHRKVRGALDLQAVRPGLACESSVQVVR